MDEVLVPAAILFLAGAVQGVSGFGFGMVAMSLLPLVMGVREAVPLVATFSPFVCVAVLAHSRRGFAWRRVAPLVVGGAIGTPLGVLFLLEADPTSIVVGLGVVLVVYGAWGLIGREAAVPVRRDDSFPLGAGAGLLGGILGAAMNTGGPPAILYVTSRGWAPDATKATLQVFFLLATLYQLGLFVATGVLTADIGRSWLAGAPGMALGLAAGVLLASCIDAATFRRVVFTLLVVLGGVFLWRGLV